MANTEQQMERKHSIVEAAFAALKENGLPSLSFDVIAKQAGVSRQVVRYHFKDSDTLMVTLCDFLAAQYRDALVKGVMKAADNERLDLFLDYFFDILEDIPKPRDDQAFDALMSLSTGSPDIRDSLRNNYSFLGQVLSHEFEVKFPSLGNQKAEELSYLFICLMYGHWKMVASLHLSEDHKYISRNAMDRLIHSYVNNTDKTEAFVQIWRQ